MTILRIEHPVPDYSRWKETFDRDPLGRARSGVRRHRILRSADDPSLVTIDLEFDEPEAAAAFLERLRELWRGVDVMRNPQARILDVAETADY